MGYFEGTFATDIQYEIVLIAVVDSKTKAHGGVGNDILNINNMRLINAVNSDKEGTGVLKITKPVLNWKKMLTSAYYEFSK